MWYHDTRTKSKSSTKYQCSCNSTNTCRGVYNHPTCKINYAKLVQPSISPDPVDQRIVDQGTPCYNKQDICTKLHTLCHRTSKYQRSDNCKHHLEHCK